MALSSANPREPSLGAWLQSETDAVAWSDSDGLIRAVSPAFADLLGLPADAVVGAPRLAILRAHLLPRLLDRAPLAASLARQEDGEQQSVELTVTLSGEPVTLWSYRAVPQAGGDHRVGWRDELADRTPTEQLERRLAEQAAALDHVREEARAALYEKDAMVARVSHELRTPMTAIIGFCHMLMDYSGELSELQRGYLQKVLKNASIQLQLLNNVLDLARIDSGRVTLMREVVAVAGIIDEALEAVEPQTWDKPVVLVREVPDDLPELTCDRLKLKQILINLLGNAVKYTDEGQVTITARALPAGLAVTVADTGIGIPAEQFERIFEPYCKLTETGRHGSVSSGLGLAIVRRLTEMMGGRVLVDSVVGDGSRFTVQLPLEPPADP